MEFVTHSTLGRETSKVVSFAVHIHPVNELGLWHVLKSGLHIKEKRTFGTEHLLDRFENNDMSKK